MWSRKEDIVFERGLVQFPDGTADHWRRIADLLPGKSPEDVEARFNLLVHDIAEIDADRWDLPNYADDEARSQIRVSDERKKGVPWTQDEHKLFLIGLERFGRGDWRSISRNVVKTRSPTQVASHAQKYFQRSLRNGNNGGDSSSSNGKQRKRSSIHDITI